MQKQGTPGSLVLVASIIAHVGLPSYRMSAYNASKGAVFMLSKALATELAPFGIRCNTISPAFTDTAQTRVVREADPINAGVMWSQLLSYTCSVMLQHTRLVQTLLLPEVFMLGGGRITACTAMVLQALGKWHETLRHNILKLKKSIRILASLPTRKLRITTTGNVA